MLRRRRTLPSMEHAYERLLAHVCDVVLEQDGDWEAVRAVLAAEYVGEQLEDALTLAVAPMVIYTEDDPGMGPKAVRGMRDRRRRLVPTLPARPWGWRATG